MDSLHDLISRKSQWYQKWHEHPLSNITHWGLFLFVSLFATSYLMNVVNAQVSLVVSSPGATNTMSTSTTLRGSIDSTGGKNIYQIGFIWGLDNTYGNSLISTISTTTDTNGNYNTITLLNNNYFKQTNSTSLVYFSAGPFSQNINVACNTTYHFKAFSVAEDGSSATSSDQIFTTGNNDPSCGKVTYSFTDDALISPNTIAYNGQLYTVSTYYGAGTSQSGLAIFQAPNGSTSTGSGGTIARTSGIDYSQQSFFSGQPNSYTIKNQFSTPDSQTLKVDLYITNNSQTDTLKSLSIQAISLWLGMPGSFSINGDYCIALGKFGTPNIFWSGNWGSVALFSDNLNNNYSLSDIWCPGYYGSAWFSFQNYSNPGGSSSNITYDPILPGQTSHYDYYIRFGSSTTSRTDISPEAYTAWRSAYPYLVNWPNRAPVGREFITKGTAYGNSFNPRDYLWQSPDDSASFVDVYNQSLFNTKVLERVDRDIAILNSTTPKPQAIAIWDLEGQEFWQSFSYVGYPNKLSDLAPEMDKVADQMVKRFRDAGYAVALTLRPGDFQTGPLADLPATCFSGEVAPYNNRAMDDIYVATDGTYPYRGFVCTAPNTWSNIANLTGLQHSPQDDATILANLKSKVAYARARWGVKMYYIDSTVYQGGDGGGNSFNYQILRDLQTAFPDCVFSPENTAYYGAAVPYTDARPGATISGYDVRYNARNAYPQSFAIIANVDNAAGPENNDTLIQSLKNGNIFYANNSWYLVDTAVSQLYQSAGYTPAPLVSITAPLNNHTVTGSSVTLTANSTYYLNSGIKGIKFQLDGNNIGPFITSTSSPNIYSTSWDSTTAARGDHTLQALSYDYIGNIGTTSINITVDNGVDTSPAINTQPTTDIAQTTATFNGYLVTTGGQSITQSGFKYGTDPAITQNVITTTLGSIATGTLSQTITGLTASTTYYVKSYATNAIGTTYGTTTSFTTLAPVPIVSTLTPDVNSGSTIIANGSITNVQGANATIRGFVYGTSLEYATTTVLYGHYASTTGSYGVSTYSIPLTGLNCNTAYHVVAFATNSRGTGYGSDQVVTTGDCTPPVINNTSNIVSVTKNSATLSNSVLADNNGSTTYRGFSYGTTDNYQIDGFRTLVNGTFPLGSFTTNLPNLTCNTTYNFNAFAYNYSGAGTSTKQTFTTLPCTGFNLTYNASAGGTIVGVANQTVTQGEDGTTVVASSSVGYHFTQWSDGSTTPTRRDTNVTADHTYTATFALIPIYRLTYVAGSHGSINGSTTQDVFSGNNGMSVTASANTGYHFVDWSDGSTNPSRTDMNVTNNHTYTANFAVDAATYTITYSADSNGSITGTTSQTINSGGNGTPVTAVPDSGYHFTQWSDGSTTPTRRDTNVTADHIYTATFVQNAANYTITYTANTGGTITGTLIQSITSGGTGSTVTAIPNQGFHFVNWNDNSTNPIRIDSNVTADHTFTASFAANSGGNNNNSNNNTTPTNTVTYGSSSGSCIAPYKFTRSLAIGSTGDDVKSLQFFLTRSGFTASSTGIYDKTTAQAVTNFQNYYATEILAPYKLKSGTGYFGPSTIKKVNSLLGSCGYIAPVTQSTPTPTPTPSGTITSTLTLGMNNNQVKLLQQILNAKGYTVSTTGPGSPGNESNYYGQKTVAALQKFQCDKLFICSGSPTTNGYGSTGPRTRALLNGTTYTPPPKTTTPTYTPSKSTTPIKTTSNTSSNILDIFSITPKASTTTPKPPVKQTVVPDITF